MAHSTTQSDSYRTKMFNLLETHTTKKYYIEYKGFLSNHVSHGLFALYKLGAPVERAEKFIQWHIKKKLENAELHLEREQKNEPRPSNVDDLIGSRESYYYIYEDYNELLQSKYKGSTEELIASEFPKLASGMIGSALHGMIHLGYGYASGLDWFTCEGLAYLHHSNVPFLVKPEAFPLNTLGCGDKSILDVIQNLRNDEKLIEFMLTTYSTDIYWTNRVPGSFQRKTGVLINYKSHETRAAEYIHQIKFPEALNATNLTRGRVQDLARWLTDCAITVCTIAKTPNDFFLLHGVTASWALKNILPLLRTVDDVLDATRALLAVLIATYLAQDYPELDVNLINENNGLSYSWPTLIDLAIKHDRYEEEHYYKLVQVCSDMSKENPSSNMESLYRLAAYHCVSNPLTF